MHRYLFFFLLFFVASSATAFEQEKRLIADSTGREVSVPLVVNHVICSGPGCLRLLTYLQAQNLAVGVEDIETGQRPIDPRPYALANPQFMTLHSFGRFRGNDNPEHILTLVPQPQVIFKIKGMGYDPLELQAKTGIPVVILDYGNLGRLRPRLYESMRIMAAVVAAKERAEEIIVFLDKEISGLRARTADIAPDRRPSVYIGGVAFKGAHGFQATEPSYPPFEFVNAANVAFTPGFCTEELEHSTVSKETIIDWNPDYLFLDLATMQLGKGAGGLHELSFDPAYRTLSAVRTGRVYGLLPYNWYSKNYGSILANAFAIGKILYPEKFRDIDPMAKADEIYRFLVGKPVFQQINDALDRLVFAPIPLP